MLLQMQPWLVGSPFGGTVAYSTHVEVIYRRVSVREAAHEGRSENPDRTGPDGCQKFIVVVKIIG